MEEEYLQHLIVRYLSNEASLDEESELLDWIVKDPSNRDHFNEWKAIWNNNVVSDTSFDVKKGLDRLNTAIDNRAEPEIGRFWLKIAASIIFLFSVAITIHFAILKPASDQVLLVHQEYKTTSGQRRTLTLDDGSTITLNANSSLKYPAVFEPGKREVSLTGEAFFQIAKDKARPFIIHCGQLDTYVLGTSFNIKSTNESVLVSVASGKVKLIRGSESEVVLPKEKVIYSIDEGRMMKMAADLEYELAWKDNTVIFRDSPLSEVAQTLQRFYGLAVLFETEGVKDCLITGKFRNKSIETVLHAIHFSTGVQSRINGNTVTFYGTACAD